MPGLTLLNGHINAMKTIFPENFPNMGAKIDMLSRLPLWEVGLDYGHSLGHGVGKCEKLIA